MKNNKDFNTKYSQYLEKNFYGNEVNDTKILAFLDKEFEKITKEYPEFIYYQIKWKWDEIRVYTSFGYFDEYCENYINNNLI